MTAPNGAGPIIPPHGSEPGPSHTQDDAPLHPKPIIGSGASPFERRYTARDLADHAGVSVHTIKAWRDRGLISRPLGLGRKGAYYNANHLRQVLVLLRIKADRVTWSDFFEVVRRVGERGPGVRYEAAERDAFALIATRKLAAQRARPPPT